MSPNTFIQNLLARLEGAYAQNTLKAFRSDFFQYVNWCQENNFEALPMDADIVSKYIDDMSHSYKSATIRRRIDSLGSICFLGEIDNPVRKPQVKLALKRMHRKIGRAQAQAQPLLRIYLDKMLRKCPKSTVIGLRNRVLLLMGYETMRRRSELVTFEFEDLRILSNKRYALYLRRSKTDQIGDGRLIPISETLAKLILAWSKKAGVSQGPILRSVNKGGHVGRRLVAGAIPAILVDLQYRARLRHLPEFSGHSFRVGAAIDLLKDGVPLAEIMLRGGWKKDSTALRYLESWAENAGPLEISAAQNMLGQPAIGHFAESVSKQRSG